MNLRRFAIALALLIAVAIPLGLIGPTRPQTAKYDTAVTTALSDATGNERTASGAPQQAVVNGWLLRDLAIIQIEQNNDLLVLTHAVTALLVAVTVAAVIGASGRRKDTPAVAQPEPAGKAELLPV